MDITSALAVVQTYIIPSIIGVGTYFVSSWAKLKNVAFKSKSQQETFLEKEWERLGTIRDYVDKKMEQVIKENECLRERIEHLEDEVDQLRTENIKLKLAVKVGP